MPGYSCRRMIKITNTTLVDGYVVTYVDANSDWEAKPSDGITTI
jgi:hypothetical protein